jgi:hypothetical protein
MAWRFPCPRVQSLFSSQFSSLSSPIALLPMPLSRRARAIRASIGIGLHAPALAALPEEPRQAIAAHAIKSLF